MESLFCSLERVFRSLLLLFLLIPAPTFALELPPIIQILEQEPKDLDDIEELVRFNWLDKAWESLKKYPEEPRASFLKGVILMGKGDYAKALVFFDGIRDEKYARLAQIKKAILLSRWKRYDESLKLFEQLRKTEKKWRGRDRLRWQAFKTALEAKKYQEGLELLKPVSSVKAKWWRGWCYFRLGQLDPALKNWDAIPLHRSFGFYPRALFWKGMLYKKIGLKEEAKNHFQKLVEKYPDHYYGFLAREQLGLKTAMELSQEDYPLMHEEVVVSEARRRRLDPYFVLGLIYQESQFNKDAVSPAGAMGLMQIVPQTALRLAKIAGLKNFQWADLFQPQVNVSLGCLYLKFLKNLFHHRPERMLAAYNAGEEAVSRWLALREKESPIFFIEEIPYEQTQQYVQKVLAYTWAYSMLYTGKVPILKSSGTKSFSIDSKTAIRWRTLETKSILETSMTKAGPRYHPVFRRISKNSS